MPDPPTRVSVLTPSYNQAEWLPDNLRSVSCQTYPHVEHIVADGGSTDGTVEMLTAAGESVTWTSGPDGGQAAAINTAFSASTGDIIGWINSDDSYVDCGVVDRVVAFFERHPDVDVVYGHGLQTTGDGSAIQILWAPPFDAELLRTLDFITQPAAFIRRSAIIGPLLDESFHFAMDYSLWLRLLASGHRFARIDSVLAIDRHQPDRKSSTITDVHAANLERLADTYDMRLSAEFDKVRTAFYLRQRVMGARLIPTLRPPFTFTAPDDWKRGLWRRQLLTRRSRWPEEYR